jgi:hypothetical protein
MSHPFFPSIRNIVRYLFHDRQVNKLRLFMTRYHGTLMSYMENERKVR